MAPPAKSQVSLEEGTMQYMTRHPNVIHQPLLPPWLQTLRGSSSCKNYAQISNPFF